MQKITGILDKISNKAELLGGALGFMSYPMDSDRGLMGSLPFMIEALKKFKFKDPVWLLNMAFGEKAAHFGDKVMGDLMMIGAGWAMTEFGSMIHPLVTKFGSLAKKAGIGSIGGRAVSAFLFLPQFNPHGGFTESAPSARMSTTGAYYPSSQYGTYGGSMGGPGKAHSWSAPNGYHSKISFEKVA